MAPTLPVLQAGAGDAMELAGRDGEQLGYIAERYGDGECGTFAAWPTRRARHWPW